jgi:hypothetical protein
VSGVLVEVESLVLLARLAELLRHDARNDLGRRPETGGALEKKNKKMEESIR